MPDDPKCPQCGGESCYRETALWVCPECSHEWNEEQRALSADKKAEQDATVRDAYGNPLQTGDSVTVIKDLKVKGSSSVVKVGTRVKSIRIVDSTDGHNIACKIDGIGAMNLKSEFVKKA